METHVVQVPLAHRALGWFEHHKKEALAGVVVAMVIGLIVYFFVWHSNEKQLRASNALSQAVIAQITTPGATQELAQPYLKVAAEYPNSAAAAQAILLAAGNLFADGKYPEAQAQFERFLKDHRQSPLVSQALLGIAACLQAEGKTDQAIARYKDLIARYPTENVVPQAKFSLATIYEAQKRPELAKDYYEQVVRESGFNTIGDESSRRLTDLVQKNPNLAPPPPAPITLPKAPAPTGTNPAAQVGKK